MNFIEKRRRWINAVCGAFLYMLFGSFQQRKTPDVCLERQPLPRAVRVDQRARVSGSV